MGLLSYIFFFGLGVIFAPQVRKSVKPALRHLVRYFILLTREVKKLGAEIREEVEDITAEAMEEARDSETATSPDEALQAYVAAQNNQEKK